MRGLRDWGSVRFYRGGIMLWATDWESFLMSPFRLSLPSRRSSFTPGSTNRRAPQKSSQLELIQNVVSNTIVPRGRRHSVRNCPLLRGTRWVALRRDVDQRPEGEQKISLADSTASVASFSSLRVLLDETI